MLNSSVETNKKNNRVPNRSLVPEAGLHERRVGKLAIGVLFAVFAFPGSSIGQTEVTDSLSHPPPSSGTYAYSPPGNFMPGKAGFPGQGETFVDPVFGTTIRRVTAFYPTEYSSQNYARNGFWNADATRFMGDQPNGYLYVIDAVTGTQIQTDIPETMGHSTFDPNNPDIIYYRDGRWLKQYDVTTGQHSDVKRFGGTLSSLGSSVDYVDASGRYWVLKIGSSIRVWDKQLDALYSGSLPDNSGDGWVGISPDGNYVVIHNGDAKSYAINHSTQSLSTNGLLFWTLCGDHGDIISASNGKTYLVTFDCNEQAAVFRVDVSIPQNDNNRGKQISDNVMLFDTDWEDSGHFSCVPKGALRDWCYVAVNSGDDKFNNKGPWRPYKSEIVMAQVVPPFTVRRLAHHRSRDVFGAYQYQPRISASWDGMKVYYASNFGRSGPGDYIDLYAIELDGSSTSLAAPTGLRIVP